MKLHSIRQVVLSGNSLLHLHGMRW